MTYNIRLWLAYAIVTVALVVARLGEGLARCAVWIEPQGDE